MNHHAYANLLTLIANANVNGETRCHECKGLIKTLDDADACNGHLVHTWCVKLDEEDFS